MFGTMLALLALGAWFTDAVGIYSVFGAFLLGAASHEARSPASFDAISSR